VTDLFDLPFDGPGEPVRPAEARRAPVVRPGPAPAPGPVPAAGAPASRVLTISELTAQIRELLDGRFGEVWVEGELSNCKQWNTGHLYFTLKDAGAQLRGVMFRTAVRNLRFKPEDGLRVVARGRVGVYEPKGEYQLVCEHMEPQGLGALQLAVEQLKRRLQAEGLFDAARKRPLPALPRRIGIVTSIDGAALRDIIKVLQRRYPNAHLVIRPSRVQGEGAALEVAAGLAQIGRVPGVDVVIVGRGGGAIEDLWAFNEEVVARAIAASPVPVISAVGHETDVTVADLVADLRAPTPSAAAELVVARKDDFTAHIDQLARQLRTAALRGVETRRRRVHALAARPALAGWPARLALRGRDVAELRHRLRRLGQAQLTGRARRYQRLRESLEHGDLRQRFAGVRVRLLAADGVLRAAVTRRYHRADGARRDLAGRLATLSPLAVLSRGYAVCWTADRRAILRDAAAVEPGERVHVRLGRGALDCTVVDRAPEETGGDR